ncbi:MAG: F0F1 ATP synthase subunit delta [Candidatus Electrothrix sp. AX2]|nr:F0F1 ATP synthase subunit delta [Candidatus Electrothrix gigas]
MKQTVVAKRYARAIFRLGQENGTVDSYAETLSTLADLFDDPELEVAETLINPLYPLEARHKVMTAIAEAAGADAMIAFLNLLLERKRIDVLREVAAEVRGMLDLEKNISHGRVTSAIELDDVLLGKIQAKLEDITGNKVILETQVDPSLIGGMIARVGDLVLDGSIRTQLNGLKESIKGRE